MMSIAGILGCIRFIQSPPLCLRCEILWQTLADGDMRLSELIKWLYIVYLIKDTTVRLWTLLVLVLAAGTHQAFSVEGGQRLSCVQDTLMCSLGDRRIPHPQGTLPRSLCHQIQRRQDLIRVWLIGTVFICKYIRRGWGKGHQLEDVAE